MSFFTSLSVSGSGLAAERLRVDLASANLANANATQSPEGGPYRRRDPVISAESFGSVFDSALDRAVRRVAIHHVRIDPRAPREVFNPSHPDAGPNGMLKIPNVNAVEEMTNLKNAQRSFEANLAAISISREMANRALRAGKVG